MATAIKPLEIEIARCGDATATNGQKVSFTENLLHEAASSYDPTNYQAPLIITHDTKGLSDRALSKSPFAYGRPDYLKVVGDRLKAVFTQKIAPEVIDWFKNGNLLSVSPSFYPPNSSFNPTPGKFSLRHIAMLGKEPPSFKGLAPVEFSESAEDQFLNFAIAPDDALDFSCACEAQDPPLADAIQRVREFLIAEKGIETADQFLPASVVQRVRAEALEEKEEYEEEEEGECEMCGESGEDDEPAIAVYPVSEPTTPFYSYAECGDKPNSKKTMHPATKAKAQKVRAVKEPLYNDTSALEGDEYEQYDDHEEEMDEEEEMPPPKAKGKKKMPQDFSEQLSTLQEQLNRLQYDFSEREAELRSQNDQLSKELIDRELAVLSFQEEMERTNERLSEMQDNLLQKEELLFREQISSFVKELESEGKVPASLTGTYAISFSEDEEMDFEEALYQIHEANPQAFDVLEQVFSGLPSFSDRTPVNFTEYNGDDFSEPSPLEQVGMRLPKGSIVSDDRSEEMQAYLAYGKEHGLNFAEQSDRLTIIKAVRGH